MLHLSVQLGVADAAGDLAGECLQDPACGSKSRSAWQASPTTPMISVPLRNGRAAKERKPAFLHSFQVQRISAKIFRE
jgi:hypothetical protein